MTVVRKKILIITYYWPPSGGSGVQRWVKFAQYLPKYGWDPIILTVDPKKASYFLTDESISIPESAEVYKTDSFEPLKIASNLIGKKNVPHSGFSNINKKSLPQKVFKFLRGNLFSIDPRKGWNKYALKKAEELINKFDINHVVTTSPPHSSQLIGLALKKKYSITWVSDLRDPWTDMFYYNDLMKLPFLKKKEEKIEKKILDKADTVITVSKGLKEIFEKKMYDASKIHIIENGYDTSDYAKPAADYKHQLKGEFKILYIGVLSELYNISSVFGAIKTLAKNNHQISLTFVGLQSDQIKQEVVDLGLTNLVTFYPYVNKDELINYYVQSDLLLLAIPDTLDNKGIITGKIFEYISMKKPVLGVGPKDGDAAAILREVNAGEMFDYGEQTLIEEFIKANYSGQSVKNFANSERYSRDNLTKKLVEIIA